MKFKNKKLEKLYTDQLPNYIPFMPEIGNIIMVDKQIQTLQEYPKPTRDTVSFELYHIKKNDAENPKIVFHAKDSESLKDLHNHVGKCPIQIFVHGWMEDVKKRTKEFISAIESDITSPTDEEKILIIVNWPGAQTPKNYNQAIENIEEAAEAFKNFMHELLEHRDGKDVVVNAHSMGCYVAQQG